MHRSLKQALLAGTVLGLTITTPVLCAPCLLASVPLTAAMQDKTAQATKPAAAAIIQAAIDKEGLAAARTRFDELLAHPDRYSFSQTDIGALGLRYLDRQAWPEALAVLEFNVRRFPDVYDVYHMLIDASVEAGDPARAEATLKAWLARKPRSESVEQRVANSPVFARRYEDERRKAFGPGQPTGVKGPYFGQTPPGSTPQVFAPGIVSLTSTSEYACTMSPDGKEFYFTRRDAPQVIMASCLGPDGWTFPEPATFSAGFGANEPHVTHDNKRIYWGWVRPAPAGEGEAEPYGIYMSERTDSGWSVAKYVGQGMYVSSTRDGRLFLTDLTPPGGFMAEVTVVNGRFASRERLHGGMDALRSTLSRSAGHPALAPDGSYIVFDISGGPHLFVCFLNADGTWGEAIDLAKHGIPAEGGIASISPDGKYLFYGFDDDIYWVSTRLLEDLRPGAGRR